jgi:dTMP kinase
MGLAMQEAMRAGFLALAQDFPERVRIIDGDRPADAIAADIAAQLR